MGNRWTETRNSHDLQRERQLRAAQPSLAWADARDRIAEAGARKRRAEDYISWVDGSVHPQQWPHGPADDGVSYVDIARLHEEADAERTELQRLLWAIIWNHDSEVPRSFVGASIDRAHTYLNGRP